MFVFMLIAALRSDLTFWGQGATVWLACGLLAGFFVMFFCPWIDAQFKSAKTPPAVVSPPPPVA
jgi:hypothetical protein